MKFLMLDIDGVMNRAGYQPDESVGLRSWIERDLADRLTAVLRATGAALVLSSDWRLARDLDALRAELAAAGVIGELHSVTPHLRAARWREIEAWLVEHNMQPDAIAIVDDAFDMGPLNARFVRCSSLAGLDERAAQAILALLGATMPA